MAIRVMHVVDSMVVGGLQNGLVNIINHLNADQFEHTVCAVRHLGPMADRLPADRARTVCLGSSAGFVPSQARALARLIAEFKPHIVHSRNWGAIEAVIAGRWVGSCAVVHSEHGIEIAAEPRRRKLFRRLAFEMADRVFTVSHHLKQRLLQATGFRAERIGVIYNGVETRRFYPCAALRDEFRQKLGLAEDEFCIGTVGRLDPVKDLMTLFRATEHLDSRRKWRLLIVGDGPESARLQEAACSMPWLKGRVAFTGDSQQVPDMMRAMDVYVLPSIFEGIANSLLEAMATGLPVVVSRTGGNPEVVADGESGYIFPVGDACDLGRRLRHLCEEPERRRQLGEKALRHVKDEFSLSAMTRCYMDLYTGVLQGRA